MTSDGMADFIDDLAIKSSLLSDAYYLADVHREWLAKLKSHLDHLHDAQYHSDYRRLRKMTD
jgi:hypothetical protein